MQNDDNMRKYKEILLGATLEDRLVNANDSRICILTTIALLVDGVVKASMELTDGLHSL